MKIKEKLLRLPFQTLAPTVAVFIFSLMAFAGVGWVITHHFSSLQKEISASTRATRSLLEISRLRGDSKVILLLYRITHDTKYLAELNEIEMERSLQSQRLEQEINKIQPGNILLQTFLSGGGDIRNLRLKLLEAVANLQNDKAEELFNNYSTLYDINSARLTDLHALVHAHLTRAEEEMQDLLHVLPGFLVIMIAIGFTLAAAMVRFFRSRVLNPLSLLHGGLSAVSNGKLGEPLPIPSTASEIKEMLQDFNSMTLTLEKTTAELTDAREQAMQAANVKSEFLANMSHEIRTPLNVIVGLSDLLHERPLDLESKKEVQVIRKSSALLLGIVNDILDYSRLESGQVQTAHEVFHLRENIENVVNMIEPLAQAKNLRVERFISSDVPDAVMGDSQLFEQLLLNLTNNAIKFTEKGWIRVRAKCLHGESGPHLELSVEDSGMGIPADKLESLFNRFVQADSSITRNYGGTGLGLAIVKQITDLFKGLVSVVSQVGIGTTFTVRFPLELATFSKQNHHIAKPSKFSGFSRPPTILLADDSEDNRFLVKKYLMNSGAQIIEVQNGREALAAFQGQPFDVVLMDIQMPELDGYRATSEIRRIEKDKNLSRTPIIALTAFAMKEEVERSISQGCDAHMVKPIRKNDLLNSIEEFL